MTDDTSPAPPPPADGQPSAPPTSQPEPVETQPADGPMFPMPTMEHITAGREPTGERRGPPPEPEKK